jgi:molybdenum cofactor cytidylyltransferase
LIVGVLLAAGLSSRFGGNKLLARLPDGRLVGEAACAALRPTVDRLVVVVRAGSSQLEACFVSAGAEVYVCPDADRGMGASLAFGINQCVDADGWLIALADMPLVAAADALKVVHALRAGAQIAVPVAGGRRGHPVGFSRRFVSQLRALDGDMGARAILAAHPGEIVEIAVSDSGSWHDVDTPADLVAAGEITRRLKPVPAAF